MIDVFLIHGAEGTPTENWFPKLKENIEEMACKVICPQFPVFEEQSLGSWQEEFKKYEKYVNERSVMVGHSLGCAFILRVLENLEKPVKACIFVSGFVEKLGIERLDSQNESFLEKEFDWEKIKKNCKNFYVIYSNNDPFVPTKLSEELSHKLDAKSFLVRGAGHFNLDSGYDEFPMVFNRIKEECKK